MDTGAGVGDDTKFIYWEKQGKDRMCGLHCLNSIVQGPMFDESSLFEIARQLDEEEKKIMEANNIPLSAAEGTNNISDDGNYNIQVLEKAIEGLGNYNLLPLDKPGVRTADLGQDNQAFLCNSADHWFAIRKVHDIWVNLNSTNMEPGPQIISDFYLDVFLEGIKQHNYTIYTVRGDNLPQPVKTEGVSQLRESQRYLGLDYIWEDYNQNKTRPLNTDGADQSEMDEAIKASIRDMENANMGIGGMGGMGGMGGYQVAPPAPAAAAAAAEEDMDPDLAEAIRLSLMSKGGSATGGS